MKTIYRSLLCLSLFIGAGSISQNLAAQSVFIEDFNDNTRGWWTGDDFQSGNFGEIKNGSYFVRGGSPVFSTWAGFPELKGQSAYTVEFTAQMIAGNPGQSFGMLLGDNGTGNDVQFCLNDGGVFIRQMIAGNMTFVRGGAEPCPPRVGDPLGTPDCNIHPFKASGGVPNRFTIIRDGTHYRFVLNDKLIKDVTLLEDFSPLIGVLVWNDVTIEVKQIEIRIGEEAAYFPSEADASVKLHPFNAENIALLHQKTQPRYATINIANDLQEAIQVRFYSPTEPSEVAYTLTVQPGEVMILEDSYGLPISIGDDWGIVLTDENGDHTEVYFVQNVLAKIVDGTFYVHASDLVVR